MVRSSFFERIRRRPPRWVRRGLYAALVVGFIDAEYRAGFSMFYPLRFAIPVLIASWWDGRPVGYALAALSTAPWFFAHSWTPLAMRASALVLLIELICRTADLATRVRVLEGLLPICMHCHRIRAAKERWVRLEEYVLEHSEANFTHGICPSCLQKQYPA